MTNKDKTKNTVQIIKGKVEEAVGKSTADERLEADGNRTDLERRARYH
jgi:uncharacterized protein YjbJ (UPF0337 family)